MAFVAELNFEVLGSPESSLCGGSLLLKSALGAISLEKPSFAYLTFCLTSFESEGRQTSTTHTYKFDCCFSIFIEAMDTSERCKRSEKQNAPAGTAFPRSVNDGHATENETDLPVVSKNIKKLQNASIKWSKATKKLIKTAVESAVDTYLSNDGIARLSAQGGKEALSNIVLSKIGRILSRQITPSMPTADHATLHRSSQDHLQKIQTLNSEAIQRDQVSKNLAANASANQKVDDSSSTQTARSSTKYKTLGTSDNESPGFNEILSARATHLGVRLQGSLDLSDDSSKPESNQDSENDIEMKIKEEKDNEDEPMKLSDPAVFTISLSTPITTNDYRFAILYKDQRVLKGLASMSAREIWQLVRDAIYHDPHIPDRLLTHPWIIDVKQLNDGCLAFQTLSEEDLQVVTTNVQWARDIRDTISTGVETYKVILKSEKARRMRTEDKVETAWIIDKVREQNSAAIPSLKQIGGIRDVVALEGPGFKRQRKVKGHPQYVFVFGSREAANAALDMGLLFRTKRMTCTQKLTCVIFSPGTQWHQQCSNCQNHDHTTQKCESRPTCGKCAYKHLTKYCTSAKFRCANCHGEHMASNKTCPQWMEAEENAHRACRFAAKDDVKSPTKPPKTAFTSSNPAKTPRKYIPQPAAAVNPSHDNTSSTNAPSALLQTIDAFRAFVLARENGESQHSTSRKRKMQGPELEHGYLMTGALQLDEHEGKRVRREKEEGDLVWPIGHKGYVPPSLR